MEDQISAQEKQEKARDFDSGPGPEQRRFGLAWARGPYVITSRLLIISDVDRAEHAVSASKPIVS